MGTYRGTIGKDYLVGSTGDDLLIGGLGNDNYVINSSGDMISERDGEGLDTAIIYINDAYTLPDNVENARAGIHTGVIVHGNSRGNYLTGGAGRDRLYGGAGDDKLEGGKDSDQLDGGTGNDYMAGGSESDHYIVDSLGDIVRERENEGTDTVRVFVSGYTLPDHVEDGQLDVHAGGPIPASMTLTGNDLDNFLVATNATNSRLHGGGGHDSLIGLDHDDHLDGGTGADWMYGGAGDDTYVIDNLDTPRVAHYFGVLLGDQVTEHRDEGNDTALVSVSGYTLAANVENGIVTTLTGTVLSGNDIANDLIGNGGGDTLFGGGGGDHLYGNGSNDELDGGAGADWLAGGEGNDTFVLTASDASGDVLTDFNGAGAFAGDTIRFVGYGPGAYLTHSDATHWAIHSADGAIVDIFTVASGSEIHVSDYHFV